MLVPMLDEVDRRRRGRRAPARSCWHGPPRPAQRAGPHPGQALRGDPRRVRGQRSSARASARPRATRRLDGRREVPPGRHGGPYREGGMVTILVTLAPNPSHLEYVNPVVEGMARASDDDRDKPGAADLLPERRAAGPHPRRRRLPRPGHRRRDAQPLRPARLPRPAARSTSSPTTSSASPPSPRGAAPPSTPATWPRASRSRSSTSTPTTPRPASPPCGWPWPTASASARTS